MKITIIGAGNVGGTTALRIAQEGLGSITLIDVIPGLAQGKAYDLQDAAPLIGVPYEAKGSEDIRDVRGSDVVVMTAGLARRPGMTREELLTKNAAVLASVCGAIREEAPGAVTVIVTNPLDPMTWYASRCLDATGKVLGMGVSLDAARFASLIAAKLDVPATSVDACVIGSHGEGMIPLPRFTRVGDLTLEQAVPDADARAALVQATVDRGRKIVRLLGSGSAYIAPSAAICQVVKAIVRDEKKKLGASACLTGQYGEKDVCLGVPCVIGRAGVEKIVELDLNEEEKAAFRSSAQSVRRLCGLLRP